VVTVRETNVRVLPAAREALDDLARQLGLSRDAAVRQLLDEHLDAQEALDDVDRLTHISTVMRHPLPAPDGPAASLVPLRLRLDDGVAQRARAVSLRLPGQYQRARREYQARLLTDAVTTAIARRAPFSDETLDGLMPLLRHGAALGLWRLAYQIVCTDSEHELFMLAAVAAAQRAEQSPSVAAGRLERVADVLREEDVGWHHSHRFRVVQQIVRRILPEGAHRMERVLYEQTSPLWQKLLATVSSPERRRSLFGEFPPLPGSFEGRGGTAIWRAGRKLDHADLVLWLRETVRPNAARSMRMGEPGWLLRVPVRWRPCLFPANEPLPSQWQAHVDGGRVLRLDAGRWTMVWPVVRSAVAGAGLIAVPRIDRVFAAARRLSPVSLVELLLVQLPGEWAVVTGRADDEWELHPIDVPADLAYRLGLISDELRQQLVRDARAETRAAMNRVIADAEAKNPERARKLREFTNSPTEFGWLAWKDGTAFVATKPTWRWSVRSLGSVVADAATTEDAVSYLTRELAWRVKQRLERAMQEAWTAAFVKHQQ